MILFFGTRPGKAHMMELSGVNCPHCGQANTLTSVSTPNYFHLFWLPVFRISTQHKVECGHCKRVYFPREFTESIERALEQ